MSGRFTGQKPLIIINNNELDNIRGRRQMPDSETGPETSMIFTPRWSIVARATSVIASYSSENNALAMARLMLAWTLLLESRGVGSS
jgi:hypothetical protein